MARKTSGKRGAAIVTLVAALAALVGPGTAAATSGRSVQEPAPAVSVVGTGIIASWAEQASWFEDASWAEE
jgi:hypothetical protein